MAIISAIVFNAPIIPALVPLALRDVSYRIHADLDIRPDRVDQSPPAKYRAMFERRAEAGQCVNQPFLGCREFAANFRLIRDIAVEPTPIAETRDLGWMLHDMDYSNLTSPSPRFFRAELKNGVLDLANVEVRG